MTVFDRLAGRIAAWVMASRNADMEAQAIDELAPRPRDTVLAIGFGPGVGIRLLHDRFPEAHVLGADPSEVMVDEATKRNQGGINSGKVELAQTDAAHLPWPDASVDGAIAVNNLPRWHPFDDSLREVVRVLRPGARLATLTLRASIPRGQSVDDWFEQVGSAFESAGFQGVRGKTARAKTGRALYLEATRP